MRINPHSYSYLNIEHKENKELIKKIFVKLKPTISNEELFCLTGAFSSNSTINLMNSLSENFKNIKEVNNEKYLDSAFDFLIQIREPKVFNIQSSEYISVGTPNEYHTIKYWIEFLKLNNNA